MPQNRGGLWIKLVWARDHLCLSLCAQLRDGSCCAVIGSIKIVWKKRNHEWYKCVMIRDPRGALRMMTIWEKSDGPTVARGL